MDNDLDYKIKQNLKKIRNKRIYSFLILSYERFIAAFWSFIFFVIFYIGISLWEFQSFLENTNKHIMNISFLIICALLLFRSCKNFRLPKQKDSDNRLEIESGISGNPIILASDKLANEELEITRKYWNNQKNNWFKLLTKLRYFLPDTVLTYRDPYSLRLVALMFFATGFIAAGNSWKENIKDGFWPYSNLSNYNDDSNNVILRIIPPEYTGLQETIINYATDEIVNIADNSIIKMSVNQKWFVPKLTINEGNIPIDSDNGENYYSEFMLDSNLYTEDGIISLASSIFKTIKFNYKLKRDNPPEITLLEKFDILENSELKFHLKVNDDYIVKDIQFNMDLDRNVLSEPPLGYPISEIRTMMIKGNDDGSEFSPYYDLTSHMWAGLPVKIDFIASDHLNQASTSNEIRFILPEREFEHPVAKYIIEQRKALIWTPTGSENEIAIKLEKILNAPDLFENDPIVFLAVRAASSRLYHSRSVDSSRAVISLLWDTALKIESGDLEIAAREVRELQQELEQALRDPNSSDEEIARIISELENALQNYMAELAKELNKQNSENSSSLLPPNALQQMVNPDDLSEFMQEMFSQSMNGNREKAQEMLSNIQKMMDILNPSITMEMPMDMQMMGKGIRELQELIEKQQMLLDLTLSDIDEPSHAPYIDNENSKIGIDDMPPPPVTENNSKGRYAEQESLRYILEKLIEDAEKEIKELPENFLNADAEMSISGGYFSENLPTRSIPHQEEAINELRKASEALMEGLSKRMQQMTGIGFGAGKRDPLGRPMDENGNNLLDTKKIKIPEGSQKKRADEIIKKLRERSSDWSKEQEELDYYKRLLDRF